MSDRNDGDDVLVIVGAGDDDGTDPAPAPAEGPAAPDEVDLGGAFCIGTNSPLPERISASFRTTAPADGRPAGSPVQQLCINFHNGSSSDNVVGRSGLTLRSHTSTISWPSSTMPSGTSSVSSSQRNMPMANKSTGKSSRPPMRTSGAIHRSEPVGPRRPPVVVMAALRPATPELNA